MKARCGQPDCDCGHTIAELERLVRKFAAHPCVDCDGCSTEAERCLTAPGISPADRAKEAEREAMR